MSISGEFIIFGEYFERYYGKKHWLREEQEEHGEEQDEGGVEGCDESEEDVPLDYCSFYGIYQLSCLLGRVC